MLATSKPRNDAQGMTFIETEVLQLELDMWHCKAECIAEVESYIKRVAPTSNLSAIALFMLCDDYDIDVRLPLAQGQMESAYGTKGIAKRTNSVWNVGAFDSLSVCSINKVYTYSHPDKSIEPYLQLLKSNYLTDVKLEEQLIDNFVDNQDRRYASYDMYEKELRYIWQQINTVTRLDSLLDRYRQYKVELNNVHQ